MEILLLSPTDPKTLRVSVTEQMTMMDVLSRPEVLSWLPPKILLDNLSANRSLCDGTYLDLQAPLRDLHPPLSDGEAIELIVTLTAASTTGPSARADLDCAVLARMSDGWVLSVEAFPTLDAFLTPGSPSILRSDPGQARYYRWKFGIETLISRTDTRSSNCLGVSTDVDGYPVAEPQVVSLDDPPPWSPHFHPKTRQYCIGDAWRLSSGRMLLGHLARHIAHVLNWNEQLRPDYPGWNAEAAAECRRRGGEPLRRGVQYPRLPVEFLHGED